MPLHPDFEKVKQSLDKTHGKKGGDEIFWKWVNKNKMDETKSLKEQATAEGAPDPLLEVFDEPEPVVQEAVLKPEVTEHPVADNLDRRPDVGKITASARTISIPAYRMQYVAHMQAGEGRQDGPIIVKAITLEEITNINGWRVVPEEFASVAAQYKQGRQLRLNHSKDVQEIIGKSFDAKVVLGKDVENYMEIPIDGINPERKYVITEFEADPKDEQVRTNILRRYIDAGSIGLDAKASCDECGKPLETVGEDMVKTCTHLNAGVKLTEVEVKEYSYVSEPAYPHSKILPTFGAAISMLPRPKVKEAPKPEESSLSIKPTPEVPVMSTAAPTVALDAAKKADAEGDGEGDGESIPKKYADAIMAAYKQGMADSKKFRADPDSDDEPKKASKKASEDVKTDQISQVAVETAPKTDSFMDAILRPTSAGLAPHMLELFKAAAEAPTAPPEIRSKFKGRFG